MLFTAFLRTSVAILKAVLAVLRRDGRQTVAKTSISVKTVRIAEMFHVEQVPVLINRDRSRTTGLKTGTTGVTATHPRMSDV